MGPSMREWLYTHFSEIASYATVVALLLSLYQLRQARKQTNQLRKIQESLSTRYLGGLKDYYPAVISLIDGAKKSVNILCDYPAYGCYTHSEYWVEYHDKLRNKKLKGKPSLTMICPIEETRTQTDKEKYFRDALKDWGQWITEGENQNKVKTFARYASAITSDVNAKQFLDRPTKEGFLGILKHADEAMIRDCFEESNVKEIRGTTPIDFWIVDEMTAIFAFSNYSDTGKMSRYGFITTDQTLIMALKQIDNFYWTEDNSISDK